jgi:hypothetical protein
MANLLLSQKNQLVENISILLFLKNFSMLEEMEYRAFHQNPKLGNRTIFAVNTVIEGGG